MSTIAREGQYLRPRLSWRSQRCSPQLQPAGLSQDHRDAPANRCHVVDVHGNHFHATSRRSGHVPPRCKNTPAHRRQMLRARLADAGCGITKTTLGDGANRAADTGNVYIP